MGAGLRKPPATRCLSAVLLLLLAVACVGTPDNGQDQLFQSAQLALRQGRLADARTAASRAIAVDGTDAEAPESWRVRLLLAEILLSQLESTQASSILSAKIPTDSRYDDLRARQQYLNAKAQVLTGALPDALRTLDVARTLSPSLEIQLEADILEGQIRLRMGEWSAAEETLKNVVKATEGKDHYRQALAFNNLGMGKLIRGRYDEALVWFEQVLSRRELENTALFGTVLYNAGICYSRLGQFDRAIVVQQRAVRLYEPAGPSLQLVQAHGSLGNTHLLQRNARTAVPFLRRAMETATAAKLTGDAAVWAANLATAHAELGDWSESEALNQQAERLAATSTSVKPAYFTLNAARIAFGRGNLGLAAKLYGDVLTASGQTPDVIWSAHAGLAITAIASKAPDRATRHFEAALATVESTRSNLLRTEFRLSFLTQLIEFYQQYVDALIDEGRAERALEIAESSRGRVLSEQHGVQTTQKISTRALRSLSQQSGAVLLSYWLAPKRSSLWIVDPVGIRHVPLPPAKELEDLVRQHQQTIHNALANPLAQPDSAGERLYRLLVEPASSALTPGARVVLVPDGALHRLNFETLPVRSPSPHYWIEDVELQIAPSLSLLTVRRETTAPPASMLLIGDASGREPEFPALRYASAEMANVAKHFAAGDVTAHHKERAVPEAYRSAALERFNLIHFTAHAVANTESPLDSAIMLSGPRESFKLYARDVADRPLNADLVTVSACRSAGERTYSGEGLVGFSWAFLRAGARRVIAGLWDVDDRSTADLMDRVYAAIARGLSPPQALRLAKLEALKSGGTYAKPYYWGPFEVFTVVLEQKQPKSGSRSTQAHLHAPEATAHTRPAY
jgi:CHAT domain-containing protein/Tfp pilus assembly protein PilF